MNVTGLRQSYQDLSGKPNGEGNLPQKEQAPQRKIVTKLRQEKFGGLDSNPYENSGFESRQRLGELTGGRLGGTKDRRIPGGLERSQLISDLVDALHEGFKSEKQAGGGRLLMGKTQALEVEEKRKALAENQKLQGPHFEEDFSQLCEDIVQGLAEKIAQDKEDSNAPVLTKKDLHKMLFGGSNSPLFQMSFDCEKPSEPLDKIDRSTPHKREHIKSAFKTSSAVFVQESKKLGQKESAFRNIDKDIVQRTRNLFGAVRAYLEDCKRRAKAGETVDVRVLDQLKSLLDKSFNPKFGGVGRFPPPDKPESEKNALSRFIGWFFERFNPQSDLRGNAKALDVLEQQMAYYERNLDSYLKKAEGNSVVLDTLATQVHGTLGQIFNDILLNPAFAKGPSSKEKVILFQGLQEAGLVSKEVKDLEEVVELQGRIRSNPLLMELDLEGVTGPLAELVLEPLRGELGTDYALSKEILRSALHRSPDTKSDRIAGRRGRFAGILQHVVANQTSRSKALDEVIILPDENLNGQAQELAVELCGKKEDGQQLLESVTKDKVFAHGMRPITSQRDTTLPPQIKDIVENPSNACNTLADCLIREVGETEHAISELQRDKKQTEELIKELERIQEKNKGSLSPLSFEEKAFFKKFWVCNEIDWEKQGAASELISRLGPAREHLKLVNKQLEVAEHRLTKAIELRERFVMAAMPPMVRREYAIRKETELPDSELSFGRASGLRKLYRTVIEQYGEKEDGRLGKAIAKVDFGSLKVEDLQGRHHSLRDLAKEVTVSDMIHQAGQRTLCSISGTTTDICLALVAEYGKEAVTKWGNALIDLADGTIKPENLPDDFRELFSSLSLFMQGGQYHTPAEVLGGMLVAAVALCKPKESGNQKLMEVRFQKLLAHLANEPENLLITNGSETNGRQHFRENFNSVSSKLGQKPQTQTSIPGQENSNNSSLPSNTSGEKLPIVGETSSKLSGGNGKEVEKSSSLGSSSSGLVDNGKISPSQTPYEEDFQKGRVGLFPPNLEPVSRQPNGPSKNGEKKLDENEVREKKQGELRKLRTWGQMPVISKHVDQGRTVELLMQRATSEEEKRRILSEKARSDQSVLKDGIDVGKGGLNTPEQIFKGIHTSDFDGTGKLKPDVDPHTSETYEQLEIAGDVGAGIGVVKYSLGIRKGVHKERAMAGELEQHNRTYATQQTLKSNLQSVAQKLNSPPTQQETENSSPPPEDLELLAKDKESLAELQRAYNKLAPRSEQTQEEIHNLRYKLAENRWKIFLRYPAGILSGLGDLVSTITKAIGLKAAATKLATIGTAVANKATIAASWLSKVAGVLGLLGIISAISSTVRTHRWRKEISRLNEEIRQCDKSIEAAQKLPEGTIERETTISLLESTKVQLEDAKADAKADFWGELLSAVSGYLSVVVGVLAIVALAASVVFPPALLIALGCLSLAAGIVGSCALVGGAIAKRNRAERRANGLNALQIGLQQIESGTLPSEVDKSNRQIAKLVKTFGDSKIKKGEKSRYAVAIYAEAMLSRHFINVHAEAVYHNLAAEMDKLGEKGLEFRKSLEGKQVGNISKSIRPDGRVPSPSEMLEDSSLAETYFNTLKATMEDGDFAKEFPTLHLLLEDPRIGPTGLSEIYWAGGAKDGMLALLAKLGVKPLKVEDYTVDSLSEPTRQSGVEDPGSILRPGVPGIHFGKFESGMGGAILGLRKYAQVLTGDRKQVYNFSPTDFQNALLEFAGEDTHTGTQSDNIYGEIGKIVKSPEDRRSPGKVIEKIMGEAYENRVAQVEIRDPTLLPRRARGFVRHLFGGIRNKIGEDAVDLQPLAQKKLDLVKDGLDAPFFVCLNRFESKTEKSGSITSTRTEKKPIPVNVFGTLRDSKGREMAPELIICNRSDSEEFPDHVTYERVGQQWYLNTEGGERRPVDLSPEAIQQKISSTDTSPNAIAEKFLYQQIQIDLLENAVVVGYEAPNFSQRIPEKPSDVPLPKRIDLQSNHNQN